MASHVPSSAERWSSRRSVRATCRERHPDLLPDHREKIGETLADPDVIRRSVRMATARLFSKWYDYLRSGGHVVVVVVSEGGSTARH